jgi:hypothetical protein
MGGRSKTLSRAAGRGCALASAERLRYERVACLQWLNQRRAMGSPAVAVPVAGRLRRERCVASVSRSPPDANTNDGGGSRSCRVSYRDSLRCTQACFCASQPCRGRSLSAYELACPSCTITGCTVELERHCVLTVGPPVVALLRRRPQY